MLYCSSTATGVYAILCKINGYWYVGSVAFRLGFRHRINRHRNELERGVHHSPILQKHFERYGEEAFDVLILEECLPCRCSQVEQFWLNLNGIGSENKSYNICSIVGKAPSFLGKNHSRQSRIKIGLKNKRRRLSPESLDRINQARVAALALEYVVTSPNGIECAIKNLTAFCRERGLCCTAMIRCAKGMYSNHKGWKCRYPKDSKESQDARIEEILNNKRYIYIVTSPKGEEFTVDRLDEFCNERDLFGSLMRKVANGEASQHKGWSCHRVDETDAIKLKRQEAQQKTRGHSNRKKYIVISPEGQEFAVYGLNEFCRQHNLMSSCLIEVARGTSRSHKGWTCRYASETPEQLDKRINGVASRQRGETRRKSYIVTLPSGEEILVHGMRQFCLDNNLDFKSMSNVVTGYRNHHRGYRCRYATPEEISTKIE